MYVDKRKRRQTDNDNEIYQYLAMISQYPLLTPEEECELATKAKNGDKKAFDRFVNCNLRLVTSIAKKYCFSGMDIHDVIQAGNVGLIEAAKRFDPTKGNKFSTYAIPWIRKECIEYAAEMKYPVSLSVKVFHEVRDIKDITDNVLENNLSDLTREEMNEISRLTGIPVERAAKIIHACSVPLSIDANLNEDNENPLESIITDPSEPSAEEIWTSREMCEILGDALSQLNDADAELIKMRFGLYGYDPMTLDEIGKTMNISRERVRQKERKIMGELSVIMQKHK